jgi:hypothetical protein
LPESFADATVTYETITAPETKAVPTEPETVTKTLEQVGTIITEPAAKEAVAKVQQAVSSGSSTTVSVRKTVEVVKATNEDTKEEVTVSIVKLSLDAVNDMKDVEVIEVIPKAAANDVSQVTFLGEQPEVLQADPVVKWAFAEVKKGESKDLSYSINKNIGTVSSTTVGVAGEIIIPEPEPETTEGETTEEDEGSSLPLILTFVIVAVIAGAYYFLVLKRKKKQTI